MLSEACLILVTIVLIAWLVFRKPAGLPPGKWGLPLVGHIPWDGRYIDEQLSDFQKQYGDIYVWKFGTQVQIFVHDFAISKQMFGSADFVNRPDLPSQKSEKGEAFGIVVTNGARWHTNRRFTLRQLRDLGMGKASMLSAVQEQIPVILDSLGKDAGKEVEITSSINTAIVNIIWKMIADKQFESDDPIHKDLQELMNVVNEGFNNSFIADMFSWTLHFLPQSIYRKLFQLDAGKAAEDKFFKYFDNLIEEHQKDLNPDAPRDVIDAYLIEMNAKTDGGIRSVEDLKYLLFDMFVAGSDTTTTTTKFAILYMAAFPEAQRKLQEEIDNHVPKGVLPTLEDRQSMPYTEAVINEVLRKSSLANVNVGHAAVKDTTLAGYTIPKGAMVTSVNTSIHHDKRYWDEPDKFLPERWLSSDGQFVMKKEGYLPFGTVLWPSKRNFVNSEYFNMADNDSRWLRKATEMERMFETSGRFQIYLTQYTLEIATVKPIDEDILRRAAVHLYRKVPIFRICFRERNSELWLREMDDCKVDIQVIEKANVEEESYKFSRQTYDSENGPLWRLRLIYLDKLSNNIYHYALIFGTHHALTDGKTNILICNLLCNILNDLMGGLPIDDAEQLGELLGDEEVAPLYKREMEKLKENPELYREIQKELEDGSKVRPLIRHICKIPPSTQIMTRKMTIVIDSDKSSQFQRTAKSHGVNLHSALTSLINLSLIKLLQEHGITQNEYNIRAGHDIDIRRYYSGNSSRILGAHVPLFTYRNTFIAPKDMLPVFWDIAKRFNEKLHSDITSRRALTTSAFRIMTEGSSTNHQEIFSHDGNPEPYYTISNMGNVSGMLSEGGAYVSVQKLTRFATIWNRGQFMVIFFHSFRNQLNMTFSYSSHFLSDEFVHRLQELFQSYMATVCEM